MHSLHNALGKFAYNVSLRLMFLWEMGKCKSESDEQNIIFDTREHIYINILIFLLGSTKKTKVYNFILAKRVQTQKLFK